jgi:hypothetical protein
MVRASRAYTTKFIPNLARSMIPTPILMKNSALTVGVPLKRDTGLTPALFLDAA